MFTAVILFLFAFGQTQADKVAPAPPSQNSSPASSGAKVDPEIAVKLLKVRRIYVESFGDDPIVKQLQAMVINSLAESNRFIVTENKDKADAILKGTGLEQTSQEFHAIGDSTTAAAASGGGHSQQGPFGGSSSGGFIAKKLATSDSQASTETVNDARLAVRLVSADGDVIWTTTKESKGAKYKGASADVADQIVKQLVWDLDKLGVAQKR